MTGSLGETLRATWRAPGGRIGLVVLVTLGLIAIVGPIGLPDPSAMPDPTLGARPPGGGHVLGTDQLNRDVLARVVSGARVSLSLAAVAVVVSVLLGTLVGVVAGYSTGIIDAVIMRTVDGAMAVPRLFLLLLLVVVWDRVPLPVLALVIGATGWFGTCRLVRGEVSRLRHEPFVLAAKALGASPARIVFRHLLPNVAGPVIVAGTLAVGDVILLEAGLSFLGLGVQPPTPSWGGMILEARPLLLSAPWTALFPGLAILAAVLSASLLGEALRAAWDPRTA